MNTSPHHEAREWLLSADYADLRHPPPVVAAHLAACETCSDAREEVLEGHARLDRSLDRLVATERTRWRWVPVPLAAAAALAALLLLRPGEPAPPAPSPLLAQLMFPSPPVVTPPPGRDAVVMERDGVTLIWLTNFEDRR